MNEKLTAKLAFTCPETQKETFVPFLEVDFDLEMGTEYCCPCCEPYSTARIDSVGVRCPECSGWHYIER